MLYDVFTTLDLASEVMCNRVSIHWGGMWVNSTVVNLWFR